MCPVLSTAIPFSPLAPVFTRETSVPLALSNATIVEDCHSPTSTCGPEGLSRPSANTSHSAQP